MTKMLETLITADLDLSFFKKVQHRLKIEIDGYAVDRRVLSPEKLRRKCRNIEILISEYETIDRILIEESQKLQFIGCCRGGVGTAVDIEAATERGIVVTYTPGRNSNAVADFTIGLLLDLTRNITKTDNLIKSREMTSYKGSAPSFYKDTIWGLDENSPLVRYRGTSLKGKNLGIIGFGRIGKLVAEKAKVLGLQILVFDPYYDEQADKYYDVKTESLEILLKKSDFVSLSCKLTEETRGIISRKELSLMKSTSYLINTARGALINEEDLCRALSSKKIAGAALDVVQVEPIPPDSPLLDIDNIILTPHIAGSSEEVKRVTSEMMARNIEEFLAGKVPENIANPKLYPAS